MEQSNVIINNVKETRRELSRFAPEVKKALDKANRETGKPLVALAQNNVPPLPLSGWRFGRLKYDQGEIKKGIKIRAGKTSRKSPWSAVTQLLNETPAGSIYELAGKKNSGKTPQGIAFIAGLNRIADTNPVSRVIWKAVKDYPIQKYQEEVLKNYADAEKELQIILDRMPNT